MRMLKIEAVEIVEVLGTLSDLTPPTWQEQVTAAAAAYEEFRARAKPRPDGPTTARPSDEILQQKRTTKALGEPRAFVCCL